MGKTNWKSKLATLEGAVDTSVQRNIHSTVIQTVSPSINFTYGRGWGLPKGFSLVLYGPPKAGKSVLTYMHAAGVQHDYPEDFVLKFNTEFREEGQLDAKGMQIFGIDKDRYQGINVNNPGLIYDTIEQKVAAWCADGMKVGLIIIDSLNGVQGRRVQESVMDQTIGDVAQTNKEGLKRILPVQRKYGFSLILTSHVAIEMDPIEQKRGNKFKMGASVGVQHHGEYFMYVESSKNKADLADLLGKEFRDESTKDLFGADGKGEQTGFKIRATMKESTFGIRGRTGQFTWDYAKGVINQHEEVFLLATRRNIIERPNNTSYIFKDQKWVGKETMISALKDSTELQGAILKELQDRDLQGRLVAYDQVEAAAAADPELEE
jgi:hypothetical protein